MKIRCTLAFLFLSCADAAQKHLRTTSKTGNKEENSLIRNNRDLQSRGDGCASTPQYRYEGASTLISVTGSFIPAQGDVSIAESLRPPSADYPKIKAICTLTAEDPFTSAPFCTLETTIDISGDKIMSMGTPPLLTIMGGTGSFEGAYGTMVTDETFVNNPDGSISFGARVDYCLASNGGGGNGGGGCDDSRNFKVKHGGRNKGCGWVGKDSAIRCTMMGRENNRQVMAMDACQVACNPSC